MFLFFPQWVKNNFKAIIISHLWLAFIFGVVQTFDFFAKKIIVSRSSWKYSRRCVTFIFLTVENAQILSFFSSFFELFFSFKKLFYECFWKVNDSGTIFYITNLKLIYNRLNVEEPNHTFRNDNSKLKTFTLART